MAGNLGSLIPAIFTGPNGERLTADQIKRRQEIAQSLLAQATDTSPNAGGWASILAKGVQGFASGMQERNAENSMRQNAEASQSRIASLLGGLTGSTGGLSQGATAANPMMAPVQGVATGVDMASPPQKIDISGDKETFVQSLLPAAIEEGARTGVDPRIIVAQAAQETGWGKSAPGNNYFGIKSHGQSGGQTLATNEVIDGKTVRINDSFRQFASPADSVKGYGEFILQNPRYKPLREAQGIDAQLQALQASGYATDPNYSRSVGAIARSISLPQSSAYSDPMVSSPQAAPMQQAPMQTAQAAPAINPAVVEALSSPYASSEEKQIASLLLERQMGEQQQQQKLALAQQQRQQEIARRQAIAQQNGINPAFASDDELWKGAAGQLFAAPSVSVVNGVGYDNRTRQPIFGTPERPTSVQEFEYGQQNPDYFAQQERMKRAGANNQNISVGGEKFDEQFGSLDAKALSETATAGMAAQRNVGRIDQLEKVLSEVPSGAEANFKQIAGNYGINLGADTSNIQAAQALINSLVPEQRQPGSGPMSDADLELFKQSLPRIINQPGGNQQIINTMRGVAQYDAEGARIVQRLRLPDGDPQKLTRAQAFEALQSRPNPLANFKTPEAPKQAENPLPAQEKKRLKFNPATGALE